METGPLFPVTVKRLNKPHFASIVWMDLFVAERPSTMLIMSTNFIAHGPEQSFWAWGRRFVAEQASSGINLFDCAWYTNFGLCLFCHFKDLCQRPDLGFSKSYSDIHDGIPEGASREQITLLLLAFPQLQRLCT